MSPDGRTLYAANWGEHVCADAGLYDRLSLLQETWESQALARHTAPDAVASGDATLR